jgi:hypothetical protein
MGMPKQWTRGYQPDPKVLELADNLRVAVESGRVRAMGLVVITPTLDVECQTAGDIDLVRKRLLAAGLIEAAQKLLSDK